MKTSKRREVDDKRSLTDALRDDVREVSLYDCVDMNAAVEWPYSTRLFGNANVGDLDLTNLQVGGQLPNAQAMLIGGWHARTDLPNTGEVRDAFNVLAQHVHVRLDVGDRPRMQDNLASLLRPNRPRSWPTFVPMRQNFSVHVERFAGALYDAFRREVDRGWLAATEAGGRGQSVPFARFWIHLDGILIYESHGLNGSALIEQVHRHMIHIETETRSVEQRIVDWVSSNNVGEDDASSAQLQAICDGILEGRWKS